eukprot:1331695-Rhodomonas_salina.2
MEREKKGKKTGERGGTAKLREGDQILPWLRETDEEEIAIEGEEGGVVDARVDCLVLRGHAPGL